MKKLTILLVLTLAAAATAAPLNQHHIPANAKWLVHVDYEAFGASEIGALLRQEITADCQKKIDQITAVFGTDPTQDLYGVTLYGPDAEEDNAVALIYAKYDKEKLLALLRANEEYAESDHKGQTLYHWFDPHHKRRQVGAFADETMIVISRNPRAVAGVLDLLKKPALSIAHRQGNVLANLSEAPQGAWVVAAADGLRELAGKQGRAAISQNSKLLAVILSETDGAVTLNLDLVAETAEDAVKIEQVVRGIQAFLMLGSKNPKSPPAELIQAVTIQRIDNQLTLRLQYPSVKLFELMKAHCKPGKCQRRNDS